MQEKPINLIEQRALLITLELANEKPRGSPLKSLGRNMPKNMD